MEDNFGNELKRNSMFSACPLENWVVICPHRDRQAAQDFVTVKIIDESRSLWPSLITILFLSVVSSSVRRTGDDGKQSSLRVPSQ